MELQKIQEGSVKLCIPKAGRIYDSPVFYNPAQIVNRDVSVLLCKVLKLENTLDLLSASGVRALRLMKEAGIKNVFANDANPDAAKLIRKNASLNKLKPKIFNLRAHELLATRYKFCKKFDYIDVDPFGTPVPFLDASVKALRERGGVIGVTATDTSCLTGTYPDACLRKYGSKSMHCPEMHELGIRILIKKIQEIGAQYDLALTPIFCHSTMHYYRVYLRAESGAEKANKILSQIGFYRGAGPLWLGKLWDEELCKEMYMLARISRLLNLWGEAECRKISKEVKQEFGQFWTNIKKIKISYEAAKLLHRISEEAKIHTIGFFDAHEIAKKEKTGNIPKIESIIACLRKKGFQADRTHFSGTGIRTDSKEKDIAELL